MKKLCGEDVTEISPTVGFNIQTLQYQGYTLNIWDVGGQKSIRPFWRNYFEQTDGIVWVVDSVDKFRLEECRVQLREILGQEKLAGETLNCPSSDECKPCIGASLLVLANKQDLGGALSFETIAQVLNLNGVDIAGRHWTILGCSGINGDGLAEGFDWIVRDIASRIFIMS
jgi:ADP-ribosylation factor-like protein 2